LVDLAENFLFGNTGQVTLLPALLSGIKIINFKYEDGCENKNKYFPAIYLSNKTIRRPPQSHETIPLKTPTIATHTQE
jgi:hypothetical protein